MENKPATYNGIERRRHERFRVKGDALVFLGKDTGTILDISQSGLAFHYTALGKKTSLPGYLDIFFAQSRFFLANLPVSLVGDVQLLSSTPIFISFQVKLLRMKFGALSSGQQGRLQAFLTHHALAANWQETFYPN